MTKQEKKKEDTEVLKVIQQLVKQYPFYGYRKITAILQYRRGLAINRKRVYRIMKENKLVMPPSHSHKKLFKGVAFSHRTEANRSNELWGIDMTYI